MENETILLRQVNPSFVQNGRITSQVFRPTPKDEAKLSVYDGDQIEAEDAFDHFTINPKCLSVGVMGVTVEECDELDLEAVADPVPFPEHALIDYSAHAKKAIEKKAKKLKKKAEGRDWLHRSDEL